MKLLTLRSYLTLNSSRINAARWVVALRGEWSAVVGMWAAALVLVLGAAWLGAAIIPGSKGWGGGEQCCFADPTSGATQLSGLLARFDSGYYREIALWGYSANGDERAFYPLYPYFVRGLSAASGLDILTAGLIVSSLAFLAAALCLYGLVRDLAGRTAARVSVASMLAYITAFYGFAFYAESLLLFLSILSVWLALRGRFLLAGLAIGLAGLTRPTGWLLIIPFLIAFLHQKQFSPRRLLEGAAGSSLAALGILGSVVLLIPLSHQSWQVWNAYLQVDTTGWDDYITWPWITLFDGFQAVLLGRGIGPDWFARASSALTLAVALLLIAAAVLSLKKLPLPLSMFQAVSTLALLCVHGTQGYALYDMPRHSLIVFPLYMLGFVIWNRSHKLWFAAAGISAALLLLFSAWFGSGRWVG